MRGLTPASILCASLAPMLHADWSLRQTVTPDGEVSAVRIENVDGAAGTEMVVVSADGHVRVWRWDAQSSMLAPAETSMSLDEPRFTLLALADMTGDGRSELVTLSPAGARAYPLAPDGGYRAEPIVLSERAKFNMRPGRPVFSPVARDVNGDGRTDLVVPRAEDCELWLNTAESGAPPKVRRVARVPLSVSSRRSAETGQLSDELYSGLTIPALSTEDVNGDGRPDLIVTRRQERAFHLQREDGSYPRQPDVDVDLKIFRDTSETRIEPGEIASFNDEAQFQQRDLDGDGIPDFVIAHRRKVWVFYGTDAGPQFTDPAAILRVADDVTALTLFGLDDDPYPDLLLVKVEIPNIGTLVGGLFREWDITVRVIGYANSGVDRTFDKTPKWRRELTARLPPIMEVVRRPEDVLARIQDTERKFRIPVGGDFDGDGGADLVVIDEDRVAFESWEGAAGMASPTVSEDERYLRRLLFEEASAVWDLDRILETLGDFASARFRAITAGRAPDARFTLRPPASVLLAGLQSADLDGDGVDELVLQYEDRERTRGLIVDVLALE